MTQNIELAKPSTIVEEVSASTKEVRVLLVPTGEKTSKADEAVGVEPVVVIFQELPLAMPESFVPLPFENVP